MKETSPPSEQNGVVEPVLTVFWRAGCSYCFALRQALLRARIPVAWHNIWADPADAAFVRSVANGNETVPTAVLDGKVYVNPPARKVRALLAATHPDLERLPSKSAARAGLPAEPSGGLAATSSLATAHAGHLVARQCPSDQSRRRRSLLNGSFPVPVSGLGQSATRSVLEPLERRTGIDPELFQVFHDEGETGPDEGMMAAGAFELLEN